MRKVALVYDRVNKWGGAERVLLALHEIFPEAPLFTSVYSKKSARWAETFPEVIPSYLNKMPLVRTRHELLSGLMPLAFESFEFSQYDLVVSVSSEAAKGINTGPGTLHICYCLTPTRYLWSGYDDYFSNRTVRVLGGPLVKYLKKWDLAASSRADVMVAISSEVRNRIRLYYKRESEIVFPPVDVNFNTLDTEGGEKNYYLVVSRLVKYKKIDLVIRAFNKLGKELVIIGIGREENRLRRIARENVRFLGFVDETRLDKYYRGAKALIMPQLEDFGIVSVEAQARGTPVIAYGKGGTRDTIINNKTGILFNQQSVESLIGAIVRFESAMFTRRDIMNNAQRFSKDRFKEDFKNIVNKHL